METEFLNTIPVLPSLNVERDVTWYHKKMGLEVLFADNMYAVLFRENLCLHLQWHADTDEDPLLGGSVIKIYVKNIQPIFDEFVQRGNVTSNKFLSNTAWNTNEFGFYDLNRNVILIMEDANF